MKFIDNLRGKEVDYSVENVLQFIKGYPILLVERDDGDAMWNMYTPTEKDAEGILRSIANGSKIEVKIFYNEEGYVVSDGEDYEDYRIVFSGQPVDYEEDF